MNRPARFTVADLRRALKAARECGPGFAVEIAPDGTIRIVQHGSGAQGGKPALEADEDLVF